MSEEKIQNITSPQPEEQEIDLIELAQKVWASRKLVFKACGHDGRYVATETHDERNERLAVQSYAVHDPVHDEGCAS